MGIVIAGERSGVGKTTITLALLAFLVKKGLSVQSFKVGPDYIDPMFHRYVTGRSCRNLDPMLTSEAYVQQCFAQHNQDAEFALVEGVMGLFDGAANAFYSTSGDRPGNFASTAHVARLLNLPVLLVVDCSRLSHSIAALVAGYRWFDPDLDLAGVVLNRVGSDRHLELLQTALDSINIPVLGVLRRQDGITIPDRHLGLVPTAELPQLDALIDRLAHLGETCFDWSRLLPFLKREQARGGVEEWRSEGVEEQAGFHSPLPLYPFTHPLAHLPRIAIAQDSAFNFYYQDNLDLLQALGAELVFWSPMNDRALPEDVQGVYLGGGFPEMFAEQLAANEPMRYSIRTAIQAGMPTYAECGGLMYLCQGITDFQEQTHAMVGILPTTAVMNARLTLGYRKVIAQQDTPLIAKHEVVSGHEFHRSSLTAESTQPVYEIWHGKAGEQGRIEYSVSLSPHPPIPPSSSHEGWHLHQLHASYIHLHWGTRPELPRRFLKHCQQHKVSR
jgi:cobyrinic acid a,c-diamide synthase